MVEGGGDNCVCRSNWCGGDYDTQLMVSQLGGMCGSREGGGGAIGREEAVSSGSRGW